jgi:hypothetical protein
MPSRQRNGGGVANYRYLATSWFLLVFYRLALLAAPYRVVRRALPADRAGAAPDWVVARTRWAVSTAARASFGATCLPQALATKALFSLQGYDATIRIGVRRDEHGKVLAHAWVLSGDAIVIGDDGERLEGFSHMTDLGRSS